MCLEFQIRFKFQLQDSFNSFFSSFWVNMRNHRKGKSQKSSPHSDRITLSEWEVEDDGKRPWLMSYEKHELIKKKEKRETWLLLLTMNVMTSKYSSFLFFIFDLNNAMTVTNHTTCLYSELWLVRGREKLWIHNITTYNLLHRKIVIKIIWFAWS